MIRKEGYVELGIEASGGSEGAVNATCCVMIWVLELSSITTACRCIGR